MKKKLLIALGIGVLASLCLVAISNKNEDEDL